MIHTLQKIVGKSKKRLGRGLGSRAGAKSGRGTTRHQKARTSIPLHFEGGQNKVTKKFPLLRGKGRNKSVKESPEIVNLDALNVFSETDVIDVDALVKAKLVSEKAFKNGVKLLGRGAIEKPVQVAVLASKNAKAKVEEVGGKIISA